MTPFALSQSNLTFHQLESKFSLDNQLIPEKGPKEFTLFLNKTIEEKMLKEFIYAPCIFKCKSLKLSWYATYGKKFYLLDSSLTIKNVRRLTLLRSGDIESNPGPETLTLMTQNCRGLKNKDKLKQLLNRCHKDKSSTQIIALQETHLDSAFIKYSWYGNFAITPSVRSKGGVITLVSANINIIEQFDIDNEAQILRTEILDNSESLTVIIVNLHSPCAHDHAKISFFKKIKEQINDLMTLHDNCEIIVMGDFNTTFSTHERINTTRSKREISISEKISDMYNDLNLKDCWDKNDLSMTWRHGDKMSRLDRIQWSNSINLIHTETKVDWCLTTSDHAAVVVTLKATQGNRKLTTITRIDTSFMSNIKLKTMFLRELDERMLQISDTALNPHGKLEFLKMTIRSLAIDIATSLKKENEREFKEIESGFKFWQATYEKSSHPHFEEMARQNLDLLTARRDTYLNERGKYLSDRSKSKWYQEGERSTKYFLNLNRSKNNKKEMSELLIEGEVVSDPSQINKYVEKFYTSLYEKGDSHINNIDKIDSFLVKMDPIDDNMVDLTNSKLTPDELLKTLKDCADSAPGPDGIPYSLIKMTWKHFGKILIDSWEFALLSGSLAPSHENSYLRLLPKDGKDPKLLKNWRPITLSNCDFKLITKTLSWRLAEAVDKAISPNQTAYMKDRQISDNLNTLLYTLEQNGDLEGMIVSLDAEKAFDSIEHWYIRETLKKIGLNDFVETFNILYKNQRVDIILNGIRAGNYTIKNGVKQGDALSCILFILGVEPLLRNINDDNSISNLVINNFKIPKAVAYADDIACMIKPNESSLQGIFYNYDRLTEVSGLKLNADKTEIISRGGPNMFKISYNDQQVQLPICDQIKINGLVLSFDVEQARICNVNKMLEAVKTQLKGWCNRNLSLLGKIQIFKTFGLSQILYTLSVTKLTKKEEKALTNLIYKFIWTKDIDANKAPDRLKRQLLLNKVKHLGFGMIDFREVVKGIRIKNLLRLLNSKQGALSEIIRSSVSQSLLNIKTTTPIRDSIDESVKLLNVKWSEFLTDTSIASDPVIPTLLGKEYIGNIIVQKFKKQKLAKKLRNDQIWEVIETNPNHPIFIKLLPHFKYFMSDQSFRARIPKDRTPIRYDKFPFKGKILSWSQVTSKMIRESNIAPITITSPKMTSGQDSDSCIRLGNIINSLTNSKLKSILLRCLHGDVYSKERMLRFGMVSDNICVRCHQTETINHMLFDCSYTKQLWQEVAELTGIHPTTINTILGFDPKHDKLTLTIHAEILRRLLAIDRPNHSQSALIRSAINYLYILEKGVNKYQINKYIEHLNR